jgi:tetratricopeptide (TPR) repeat protein
MKNVLAFLLALYFSSVSIAQTENLDSLAKVTETLDDTDTNKVFNYCDIALKYAGIDELNNALAILKKAEPLLKKVKNKRMTALYYYLSGRIHYSKGNSKESLSYLLKGMKFYEELKNKGKLSSCYNIIGLIYQDQTIYDKAGIYLKKALVLSLETQDSMRLSGNYSNLGLNYYKQAHKKNMQAKDCIEMREAFKHLNTALVIAKRMRLPSAEATALGNLSNIMNDRAQYTEAKTFAEKALKIYQNMGDAYQEAISLLDLASISLSQNKPKDAIPYLQHCLNICTTNQFKDLERYIYGNLATATEKLNDYKQAFIYEKKLIALNDSAFNSENLKQINEMQIKYESEKKESENALLLVKNELSDKALKNQRTVMLLIIIGLILTLALALFIFRGLSKQKKANHIISQQKREVENKNALINKQHELLEAKQKEILDSIQYAKRIQTAQMPTDKYVSKNLDRLKKD